MKTRNINPKNFFSENKIFWPPIGDQKPHVKKSIFQLFYFSSKLADFWYSGVFGHEKSIGASPEFQKNFFDPLSGYPMLKNQFFQLFYFGSKLADFWYSGVFGHEKSIGAGPEFQKNFFDPLLFSNFIFKIPRSKNVSHGVPR